MRIGGLLLGVVVAGATSAMERQLLGPRKWNEFQPGSQRLCPELRCRPLMTMALDVVASLELATDDAKAMNFAGLCCLVTGSVIAGAPRAIRKGRRVLQEPMEGLQGGPWGALEVVSEETHLVMWRQIETRPHAGQSLHYSTPRCSRSQPSK